MGGSNSWSYRSALIIGASVCALTGCGSGGSSAASSEPSTASPSASEPSAASTSTATQGTVGVAPPRAGTTLLTREGDGTARAITSASGSTAPGAGFAIVGYLGGSPSTTGVIAFGPSGQQLAEVSTQVMTTTCGALDLAVPSVGRIILTEHIASKPAEGIHPELQSATLDAWNASTGAHVWSAIVVPPRTEKIECNPYANLSPTSFGATADARWGVWSLEVPYGGCNSCQATGGEVINLTDGVVNTDKQLLGTLGSYVVDSPPDQPVSTLRITDPATGAVLGTFQVTSHRHLVDDASQQMVPLASAGYFPGDPAAISTDGNRAIVAETPEDRPATIGAYALPRMSLVWRWHSPYEGPRGTPPELVADGGGILLVYVEEPSGGKALLALDDRTAKSLWSLKELPNEEKETGPVCGLSSSQALVFVNGQYATLDLHTGKQISYTNSGPLCQPILPNGIEELHEEHAFKLVQRLNP